MKPDSFAHIIRGSNYQLLQNIMEGKIQGRRRQGRRRTSLRNLREWFSMMSTEMFRANEVRIYMMIANFFQEMVYEEEEEEEVSKHQQSYTRKDPSQTFPTFIHKLNIL